MKLQRIVLILALTSVTAALAQQGPADALWPLMRQGEYDEVIRQGKALLSTGTETAAVNLAVGQALVRTGGCNEAEIFLARAIQLDSERTWVYAWGNVELGNCRWYADDAEGARRAWIAARDAAATANATNSAEGSLRGSGLAEFYDEWSTFTTDHFEFRFSPQTEVDRAWYARSREEAFAVISAWFGGAPEGPIRFHVWSDQAEADARGMPVLGFSLAQRRVVPCRLAQSRGHEMTHVISYHALAPTLETGLINEGIAVFMDLNETDRMADARSALAAATGLPEVAVAALWEDWSLLPTGVSYAVAGAWVERLIEKGGKERFMEFFRDQGLMHAREIYGADLESWMREFDADLHE